MSRWPIVVVRGLLLSAGALTVGCATRPAGPAEEKPLKVSVSTPVVRTVTDYETFSGRTEAVETTDVRARVSGYLTKVNFVDGAHVQAGDVLFEIDPRPYEAALAKAKASVAQAQAAIQQGEFGIAQAESNLDYLAGEYQRNRQLARNRSVSDTELDKSQSDVKATSAGVKVAKANVEAAKANLKAAEAEQRTAQLNVDFTKVLAPIRGVVSRRMVDRGALINADTTLLTNIVRLDQVYAYFDVDERTWLDLRRRLVNTGQLATIQKGAIPVWIGLASDTGYSYEGHIDFADNKLDPSTGTMRMRGTFENGDRYFQPGMFVRVRLPIGQPHGALLIAEQAIGNDQGRQFVYVVNDKDEVVYRRIETGALHDGLREIKPPREDAGADDLSKAEGLRKGDRVVLNGLQRLRPGMKVEPNKVPMPNPRQAAKSSTAGKKGAVASRQ